MLKLALSLATVVALTSSGCKAADTEAGAAMLKQLHVFKDAICGCKDPECMIKNGKALEDYGTVLEKSTDQASDGQAKEAKAVIAEINACSEKFKATYSAPAAPAGSN